MLNMQFYDDKHTSYCYRLNIKLPNFYDGVKYDSFELRLIRIAPNSYLKYTKKIYFNAL